MSELRDAYKKYGDRLRQIIRDPTDEEKRDLLPALHSVKRPDGTLMDDDEFEAFMKEAWLAKQIRDLIDIIMEAES